MVYFFAIMDHSYQLRFSHASFEWAACGAYDLRECVAYDNFNGTIKVCNIYTGEIIHTLTGHQNMISSLTFSLNGTMIASSSSDGTARLWNLTTGKCKEFVNDDGCRSVAINSDNNIIAIGQLNGTIQLLNVETGQNIHTLIGHTDRVLTRKSSLDNSKIISGSEDGTMRLWNVKTGELLHYMVGHTGGVTCAIFNSQSSRIVTGCKDKILRIWSVTTGELIQKITGHRGSISAVSFDTNDMRIVSSDIYGSIHLWNSNTGELIQKMFMNNRVLFAVVDADNFIIACDKSGTIIVWGPPVGSRTKPALHDTLQ